MPIFDYKCNKCGRVHKDVFIRSSKFAVVKCGLPCGGDLTKLPSVPNMHLFPKDGIHLSNVSPEGKTFYSKREMMEYARENNVELGALL